MKIDNEIKEIVEVIKLRYKDKFNKIISEADIVKIIESQFDIIPIAFERKEDIKFTYLGKFLVKETFLNKKRELRRNNIERYKKKGVISVNLTNGIFKGI